MHLPINIDAILNGKIVESERIEFKKGWNPEDVLHSLCAFANDFHNLGGGYIFIGVEEKNGQPVLPPCGLSASSLDKIQKEIIALGHRIHPDYHPIVAPYVIQDRHILVLWAYGGQTRPYKVPVSISKDCREYAWFIRKASATVRAKGNDERELLGLAATVPYDDRIRQDASIEDLDLSLIRTFLRETGSDLYKESGRMDFNQLCRQMNIVSGPDEFLRPLNAGLMFFNENPQEFFPYSQIDVVQFPDGRGGDQFTEKIFKGPLNRMLNDALNYINSILIEEIVIKHSDRAEAERLFNYPYVAIEEALVNAAHHRGYDIREPIEVQILPDEVIITSQPGPDHSISMSDLKKDHFVSRRYRNRRIGEFLKELDLVEGRGTGIPKIMRAIRKNKSPRPIFETDEDRTYFAVKFPIHPKAKKKDPEVEANVTGQVTTQVGEQVTSAIQSRLESRLESQLESRQESGIGIISDKSNTYRTGSRNGAQARGEVMQGIQSATQSATQSNDPVKRLLCELIDGAMSSGGLRKRLNLKHRPTFRKNYLRPALSKKFIEPTIPDKPNSRLQKYRLTPKGRKLLEEIRK